MIRGEPHSVPLALERSLGHIYYHIGQIVQVARIHARDARQGRFTDYVVSSLPNELERARRQG
jgi:hypothetical protein